MSIESEFFPVARPSLGEEEVQAVRDTILSGWVTQGPEVAAFENDFAKLVGSSYSIATSNCTAALHLALLAAGVGPGDEVITVSHSFIAAANAVRYCGAEPVFIDIDLQTYNLDPELLPEALSPQTKAILAVHQMGMPCDIKAVVDFADEHGLAVIEDAACAVGSEIAIDNAFEPVGRPRGFAACFSFHPRKLLTTGDGGMITTNDESCAQFVQLHRHHGMSHSDRMRSQSTKVIFETYDTLGFNYRMTDIQAAVGRQQLRRLPDLVTERRRLGANYTNLLADIKEVKAPYEPSWSRSNWQSYCVLLPSHVDQVAVMQNLLEHGIATRRGVMCAHREKPYQLAKCSSLERSEIAQDRGLILPLYAGLSSGDQEKIVSQLAVAISESA